jgi:hypothetical protein
MLNVVILSAVTLNVIMMSVVILSVITLNVVMLSVVMLNAPMKVLAGNTKGGSITVPLTSCFD